MHAEAVSNMQNLPLVVGVDLGGTQIRVAVLQGRDLLSRVGLFTGDDPSPERIIRDIDRSVHQALEEANTSLDEIVGIGVGVPGPVNSSTGVVYTLPNVRGWDHFRLGERLHEHFNTTIVVENDANAAGIGEYLFGVGQDCKNMFYLTISYGVGGCMITNGKIMRGISGTAGEVGHMTIDWHAYGEKCNCGNIGCLERFVSGTAIVRHADEIIAQGVNLFAFAQTEHDDQEIDRDPHYNHILAVALAAEAGMSQAHNIIATAAEALAVGLVNIIHIFNPEMIILGGSVTQILPMLVDSAQQFVKKRAMEVPRSAVRIVPAKLSRNVGLIGAGALIYHDRSESSITT